ncbi:aldolase/citrate lyase family protein [Paenibacillus sp. YYML68]|uniref:aldolase/citrate lyase family protein n=1 Tax=Paenibacillus sp. YYML68 TaxID=2909250 RepID=UPI00249104F1|nr:aldolase/citrate lyase family protein [Paenibacillus sp. YYML68]
MNPNSSSPFVGIWTQSPSKEVSQVVRRSPFLRWIAVDLQHGYWSLSELESFLSCCGTSSFNKVIPLVRTGIQPRAADINAILDAGAWGVIIPCVESVEQVSEIRMWSSYPPYGNRSVSRCFGMPNTGLQLDQYIEWSHHNLQLISMIETEKGLQSIDKIALVSDGIMFGMKDLSLSLSIHIDEVLKLVNETIAKHSGLMGKFGYVGIPDCEVKHYNPYFRSIGTIRDLLEQGISSVSR